MRALIVDDEVLARREMWRLLAEFSTIEIVGEAGNIFEAEEQIVALRPDLVFLDIEMPGGNAFDLLLRLEETPQVIFTTAYDRHAIQAFTVNALDYLLKPIEPNRLAAAIGRVRLTASAPTGQRAPLEQLFVRDGPKCFFVPLKEVRLFASEGNYVRIFWDAVRPLLGRSLVDLELRLDPKRFFRANRKQILNLDFVTEVEMGVGSRLHVSIRGGPEVELSRRQARLFRERTEV